MSHLFAVADSPHRHVVHSHSKQNSKILLKNHAQISAPYLSKSTTCLIKTSESNKAVYGNFSKKCTATPIRTSNEYGAGLVKL
jgi:hypothetical protein